MSTGYVETPEQELKRLREQNAQWLEESAKWQTEIERLRSEVDMWRTENNRLWDILGTKAPDLYRAAIDAAMRENGR